MAFMCWEISAYGRFVVGSITWLEFYFTVLVGGAGMILSSSQLDRFGGSVSSYWT